MAKINKLQKSGQTIYPLTIPEAVIDSVSGKTQKQVNDEFYALSKLVDSNLGWYGIEWDITVANSACTRIGSMELHRELPIHSGFRRCLLLDNGKVNYYLHPNDSTKRDNGASANLSGVDGQVMVEIPQHYRRFQTGGNKRRAMYSTAPLSGFHRVPKMYISAYEATVQRSNSKLSSVVNMGVDFRGGNNSAASDATSATQLGRAASSISLTNFRAYARNRGSDQWNCNTYEAQKTLLWLMAIEYANFNNQLAYDPQLTSEGFRKGGLGDGVTDLNSALWITFNAQNPFVPCGFTNSLGNQSGVKPYAMPVEYNATIFTTNVPSYRGVENPYGHVWKWADGCKVNVKADDSGGVSEFYVCNDVSKYQDSNYTNYVLRGLLPRESGYIKEMIVGEFGEAMPSSIGGSATTYFCDYLYANVPASGESLRGVLFGGSASYGASAGIGSSNANYTPSAANASFGSRLCFMGV